jgi:hypothetical protein
MKQKNLIWLAIGICIFLAIFVSPFASKFPDGLEFVVEKLGFIDKNKQAVLNSPAPDYNIGFIKNEYVSKALSGLFGVVVVFALGWGIDKLLRKRK